MAESGSEKILIAVPTYGQCDSRILPTIFQLAKLPGTDFMQSRRAPVDKSRNGLVRMALESTRGYDFIFFLDDDMVVEDRHAAELLDRLIGRLRDHPEVSVVGPRAYRRTPPLYPCVFAADARGELYPLEYIDMGILNVDSIHFAATLVRTEVFRKIPPPWFEFIKDGDREIGEDIAFCRKISAAKLGMQCDTNLEIGHLSDPGIVNSRVYESWKASQKPKIHMPTEKEVRETHRLGP